MDSGEKRTSGRRHRRVYAVTALLLTIAALVGAYLGGPSLVGAPTFTGNLIGAGMLLAAAVGLVGAGAAIMLWRGASTSARTEERSDREQRALAVVFVAALAMAIVNAMMLVTQLALGDPTPALVAWAVFLLAAVAIAGYVLKVTSGHLPMPRKIAVGAVVTAVAAVGNFAYTQLYLPSVREASIAFEPAFGTPIAERDGGYSVPFTVDFAVGTRQVFILAATYQIVGRRGELAPSPRSAAEIWPDSAGEVVSSRTTTLRDPTVLQTGHLIDAGSQYVADYTTTAREVVRVPRITDYDALQLRVYVSLVRADRVQLGEQKSANGDDWNAVSWPVVEPAVYRYLRRPVWITSEWDHQTSGPGNTAVVYQYDRVGGTRLREPERYGGWEVWKTVNLPLAGQG